MTDPTTTETGELVERVRDALTIDGHDGRHSFPCVVCQVVDLALKETSTIRSRIEELERERDDLSEYLMTLTHRMLTAETSLQEARGLLERIDREDQNMTDATVSGSPDHVFQEAYDMRDEAIKAIRPFLSSTKRENVRQMTDGLLDDRGLCMPHCSNGHHGECSEGDCRCEDSVCVAYRREWYEGYSEPSTKETE